MNAMNGFQSMTSHAINNPPQLTQYQPPSHNFGNIFKSYKQMQGSQTSTSINLPKGVNSKRQFGRESYAQSHSQNNQGTGLQKKKGASQGAVTTTTASGKYQIHPALTEHQNPQTLMH